MLLEWLQLLTRNPAYAALLWPCFPFANCSFALSGNVEPSSWSVSAITNSFSFNSSKNFSFELSSSFAESWSGQTWIMRLKYRARFSRSVQLSKITCAASFGFPSKTEALAKAIALGTVWLNPRRSLHFCTSCTSFTSPEFAAQDMMISKRVSSNCTPFMWSSFASRNSNSMSPASLQVRRMMSAVAGTGRTSLVTIVFKTCSISFKSFCSLACFRSRCAW